MDGVTSAQENAYTFDHYFGRDSANDIERQDDGLAAHRDFAGDGGFLCPSGTSKSCVKNCVNLPSDQSNTLLFK